MWARMWINPVLCTDCTCPTYTGKNDYTDLKVMMLAEVVTHIAGVILTHTLQFLEKIQTSSVRSTLTIPWNMSPNIYYAAQSWIYNDAKMCTVRTVIGSSSHKVGSNTSRLCALSGVLELRVLQTRAGQTLPDRRLSSSIDLLRHLSIRTTWTRFVEVFPPVFNALFFCKEQSTC